MSRKSERLSFFQRPLFGVWYWKRIRATDGISEDSHTYKRAFDEAIGGNVLGGAPAFEFTETQVEWVMLYNIARQGQITPKILKNMRRVDLYYLAGHTTPHPAFVQPKDSAKEKTIERYWDKTELMWEQGSKLLGNATRAKTELERRSRFWIGLGTIFGALAGGFLGSDFLTSL